MGQFLFDPTLLIDTAEDLDQPVGWTSNDPVARDQLAGRLEFKIGTGEQGGHDWKFTTTPPAAGWPDPDFDDSAWKTGKSGFGTEGTPGIRVGTVWNTPDIWLRTTLEAPAMVDAIAVVSFFHDEDVEVFVNGKPLLRRTGYITSYERHTLSSAERGLFREGPNTIAVHCRQTGGGQGVDLGLGWVKTSGSAPD